MDQGFVACSTCGLVLAKDRAQRLETADVVGQLQPGDVVPYGRCPVCDGMTYPRVPGASGPVADAVAGAFPPLFYDGARGSFEWGGNDYDLLVDLARSTIKAYSETLCGLGFDPDRIPEDPVARPEGPGCIIDGVPVPFPWDGEEDYPAWFVALTRAFERVLTLAQDRAETAKLVRQLGTALDAKDIRDWPDIAAAAAVFARLKQVLEATMGG